MSEAPSSGSSDLAEREIAETIERDAEVLKLEETDQRKLKVKSEIGDSLKSAADKGNEFECRWADCNEINHHNLTGLVSHLNSSHLAQIAHLSTTSPIRYTCLWEGCSRYGIEQPSRFALISHCRTHTGEKPYFCSIPECEKHFTRSDALAKHVKGVHDLHSTRDSLEVIKQRVKKGSMEPFVNNLEDLTEDDYIQMILEDSDIRNPWWFNDSFVEALKRDTVHIKDIYNEPFQPKSMKAAVRRYDLYLQRSASPDHPITNEFLDDDTIDLQPSSILLDQEINNSNNFADTYNSLQIKLTTAKKINKILTKQLSSTVIQKRKLWLANQILLDSNVKLGLPKKDNQNLSESVTQSTWYDDMIMSEDIV